MSYLHLILNTYTKTEVDTQLTDYMTLIGKNFYDKTEVDTKLTDYMTTLSITETLINSLNNYATIAFLGYNFYDKLYLDNQFSLKANASNHYNKTETDNMLLSYSTGSYVDFNFYNKSDTDYLLANINPNIDK